MGVNTSCLSCQPWENAVLKSVIVATSIGILGGLWIALLDNGIELFQNYVDGVWRYQVEVRSFAAPLIGAVVGGLAGSNIRLALAEARSDAFVRGALAGCAVGALLVAGQAALVVLAALLQVYDVEYGFLLTRFVGIFTAAALIGAVAGLLGIGRLSDKPVIAGAVVGALTAGAFLLPNIVTNALAIATSSESGVSDLAFFATYLLPSHLSVLLAGMGSGAIIGAAHGWRGLGGSDISPALSPAMIGILLGTLTAVTASSPSFHYVVLGLLPADSSLSLALYVFRALLGLFVGSVVGVLVIAASRRLAPSRRARASQS